MRQIKRKRSILWISITLLTIQLGCTSSIPELSRLPQPPSEQLRAHLGTIGVVSVKFVPELMMLTPTRGGLRGAARGAREAEKQVISVTPGGCPLTAFLCVVFTPFALCGGAMGGAINYPPAAELKKAQEELDKYVPASIEIQKRMRAQFLQVAREETHYAFFVLENQGPVTHDEKLSYDNPAGHGISAVLEMGVLNFGLIGDWTERNPPLRFFMTLHTKLIRVADGEVVYTSTLRYKSLNNHLLEVWAANDAQLFKEELSPCYSILAEKIVEEVFLLYLPSAET